MYTIIGGDGREYGPVSVEQVRAWITAGRANLETKGKAVGTDEWKSLGEFPDFQPAEAPAPASAAGPVAAASAAAVPAGPEHFDPLECYSRSWALLRENFWPIVGMTALSWIIGMVVSSAVRLAAPFELTLDNLPLYMHSAQFKLTIVCSILINQPLFSGYAYYLLRRVRGEAATVADLFSGFTRAYPQLLAGIICAGALQGLGFLCLVLPGIYLAVSYALTQLTIVDRRCGFWAGMELSRRGITRRWWSFLLLLILAALLILAGFLFFVVGILVAFPLVVGAMIYAYLDLIP